ncbi:MCE family protein [Mycolicibacterium thermoresistibile]
MARPLLPATPWLALRGLLAVGVAAAIATALIARATGNLEQTTDVFVAVPASAGLITGAAPVRYHGVNVGRIAAIESGTETSQVRLAIDDDALGLIPSSVVARIVPRTFFGDIYLQLVDAQESGSVTPLRRGAQIDIDDSAEAMALYDVFKKLVDVFSQIQPERTQAALTALSQALTGRGAALGSTIDELSAAAEVLTPTMLRFLDTTPQFRDVMKALHTATPDIVSTLADATAVSHRMLEHQRAIGSATDALARLGGIFTAFLDDHREHLITVIDSAGTILATTGANPDGLVDTLAGARSFGAAGSRVFSTGKFNITAVATFAQPMPYTVDDCPQYGTSVGAHCAVSDPYTGTTPTPPLSWDTPAAKLPDTIPPPPLPAEALPVHPGPDGAVPAAPASARTAPVVDAPAEAPALAVLERELLGPSHTATTPHAATALMLGPLVRGTEVQIP